MEELGASITSNLQKPYIIRVWAIRDIMLSLLVIFADKSIIKTLLIACVTTDFTDIISVHHLSSLEGLFNPQEIWSLKLPAIVALIPETLALVLLTFTKTPVKSFFNIF